MSDLHALATGLQTHLSVKYSTTSVTRDTWWVTVGGMMLRAAAVPLPWVQSVLNVLDEQHQHRSVALPALGGKGAIIVYSEAALADPLRYAVTSTHEHEHARVLKSQPDVQVALDYANAEMRAAAEARAYACGAFTRYLLTGNVQSADEIVAPLCGGYLLSTPELSLARGLVASDLASMKRGAVPPHEVCAVVLAFLQAQFPAMIVPVAFRVAA